MLTDRTPDPGHTPPEEAVTSGRVLRGRFVLEEQLEHGRLGIVFSATDRQRSREDGTSQHVAILILPAEVVRNARQLETFKREFASVQALAHPNIVGLYDFDRDGDTYYVVMELVDGESLRNIVDSLAPELLSEHEALEVVRAVGESLLYAHASGIVHGDVRAENVLVTARHEIKLMFVSACLARSAPFSVDPRDDVYGLASLAYQLLSGEIPPATGLQRAGARHSTSEPPRIKGLTRGRWNALRSGLAPRDKRSRSIRQFLAGLGVPERELPRPPNRAAARSNSSGLGRRLLQRAVMAVAAMGAIVAIVFGVLNFGVDRLAELPALITGPDVPTPLETQTGAATVDDAAEEDRGSEQAAGAAAVEPDRQSEAPPAEAAANVSEAAAANVSETASGDATSTGADSAEVSTETVSNAQVETIEVETPEIVEAPTADEPTLPTAVAEAPAEEAPAEEAPAEEARAEEAPAEEATRPAEGTPAPRVASAADPAPPPSAPAISFGRQDFVVTEGQGVVAVEVTRSNPSGRMSAIWWTSDGTAVATDDYADFGRVAEGFADGERSRTILIPITSDALIEDREYFYVNLSALSSDGTQQGELSTATVTIVDDDR